MTTSGTIRSYRDLIVWQRSMELVVETYVIASLLPADESNGLRDQMRRAAVSVAANIAEGHGRAHRREYVNHLSIAKGSLMELHTHLEIVARVHLVPPSTLSRATELADRTSRMLAVLIRKLAERDG
jgi:four helix bundle protein